MSLPNHARGPAFHGTVPPNYSGPNGAQFQPSSFDQGQSQYDYPSNYTHHTGFIPPNPFMGQNQPPHYPAYDNMQPQTGLSFGQGQYPETGYGRQTYPANASGPTYNAAMMPQQTWSPQGTSQFPDNVSYGTQGPSNNATAYWQNPGTGYQATQPTADDFALSLGPIQAFNNAAPFPQSTSDAFPSTQELLYHAAPDTQSASDAFQSTQQPFHDAVPYTQSTSDAFQSTQQSFYDTATDMQYIDNGPLNHYPSMIPDTPQSTPVAAAASVSNAQETGVSPKALEKAVEQKAGAYGLDTPIIRQLRAYANAREKGIDASEPEDAVSQHIIYEFQQVRQQHPTYIAFPDYLPGTFILLPGQKTYNKLGQRNKGEECRMVRETLHARNRDRWNAGAAAPPLPIGSKPQEITNARPVKQRKITHTWPMQPPNAVGQAALNQPYFTPAYGTMDQQMSNPYANFADPMMMAPPMMPAAGYNPYGGFVPDNYPMWSTADQNAGPLQPMPAVYNGPYGQATATPPAVYNGPYGPATAPPPPMTTTTAMATQFGPHGFPHRVEPTVPAPAPAPRPPVKPRARARALARALAPTPPPPPPPPPSAPAPTPPVESAAPPLPPTTSIEPAPPPSASNPLYEVCTTNSLGVICKPTTTTTHIPCHSGSYIPGSRKPTAKPAPTPAPPDPTPTPTAAAAAAAEPNDDTNTITAPNDTATALIGEDDDWTDAAEQIMQARNRRVENAGEAFEFEFEFDFEFGELDLEEVGMGWDGEDGDGDGEGIFDDDILAELRREV